MHLLWDIVQAKKQSERVNSGYVGGLFTSQTDQKTAATSVGSIPLFNDTLDSTLKSESWLTVICAVLVYISVVLACFVIYGLKAAFVVATIIVGVMILILCFDALRRILGEWITTCTAAVVQKIREISGRSKKCIIVGHSHGCLVAHMAAGILKEEGYTLYILSTGSPTFYGKSSSLGDFIHKNDPVSNWSYPGLIMNRECHSFSKYMSDPANLILRV